MRIEKIDEIFERLFLSRRFYSTSFDVSIKLVVEQSISIRKALFVKETIECHLDKEL